MKHLWIGLALLALLLGAGGLATVGMDRICEPLGQDLTQAADRVQAGEWDQAISLAESSHNRWTKYRNLCASITNHEPMEEVDMLFDSLQIFADARDPVRFADCCARLSALTDAISEAQALVWWNVF